MVGYKNMADTRTCYMVTTLAPQNLECSNGLEYYKNMELLLGYFCVMSNNSTAVDSCKQWTIFVRDLKYRAACRQKLLWNVSCNSEQIVMVWVFGFMSDESNIE
jgi:hypothetical protein